MVTYITHPQASNPASHPIRLNCLAVHQSEDRSHQFDVLVPMAIAGNHAAIGRLVSKALKGSWAVVAAVPTADCF